MKCPKPFSQRQHYLLWWLSMLFLHGCGEGEFFTKPQSATAPPHSVQLMEQGCDEGKERSLAAGQVEELLREYQDFAKTHNEQDQLKVMGIEQFADEFKSSHRRPHIMSEKILSQEVTDLRNELKGQQERATIDVEAVNEIAHEMVRLKNKAARWQAQQCALEGLEGNDKNDYRFFIDLQERREIGSLCLDVSSAECDQKLVDELKKDRGQGLIRLCQRYHSPAACAGELRIAWGKANKELKFFRHYFDLTKRDYLKFFSLERTRNIQCTVKNQVKTLLIPVLGLKELIERTDGGLSRLNQAVNEQWGRQDFSVQLKDVSGLSQAVFSLSFHDKYISQVREEEKPKMFLANYLRGEKLLRIFNHELGHVLGFPDCYIEYYDKGRGELIYYTLQAQQQNLMCEISPEARVPQSYLDQLEQRYCP